MGMYDTMADIEDIDMHRVATYLWGRFGLLPRVS